MHLGPLASRVAMLFAIATLVACAETLPVAPTTDNEPSIALARVTPVAGEYQLSFLKSNREPATTLTVGQELVLKAHVQKLDGTPAQAGSVTFSTAHGKVARPMTSTARMKHQRQNVKTVQHHGPAYSP